MKKIILLALTALMMVGCNMAMDSLDIVNGSKYVVKAKRVSRNEYGYIYNLVKDGDSWYDYAYEDTAEFNVGDTLVIIVRRVDN
jgi:flagellar basal body L-ring protein FlgH